MILTRPKVDERQVPLRIRAEPERGPVTGGRVRARSIMRRAMPPIRWLTAIVVRAWAVSVARATEPVWEALRTPGAVVVLRHSYARAALIRWVPGTTPCRGDG